LSGFLSFDLEAMCKLLKIMTSAHARIDEPKSERILGRRGANYGLSTVVQESNKPLLIRTETDKKKYSVLFCVHFAIFLITFGLLFVTKLKATH
jgi:hypothetical protein